MSNVLEIILHGFFNRHSWCLDEMNNVQCRICYDYKQSTVTVTTDSHNTS